MNAFQIYNSLTIDTFKTVSAVFTTENYSPGSEKKYTYKVPLDVEVSEGDFAVVKAPSGLTVVTIVEVHDAPIIDHSAKYLYKYVISIFNTEEYDTRLEAETKNIKLIKADMQIKLNEESACDAADMLTSEGIASIRRL